MGEYADAIIDRMMWSYDCHNPRRRQRTFQSGSGNFIWRTGTGEEIPMLSMTDDHLANAIRMCERTGNSGKERQLRQVLADRNK